MKLPKLTGSEKQIAWAEDIREGYIPTLETLRACVETLSDLTMEEYVEKDPVLGDETRKRYAVDTNNTTDMAAFLTADAFVGKDTSKDLERKFWERTGELQEQGSEHHDRIARMERYEALAVALEAALENESTARFWIDRR